MSEVSRVPEEQYRPEMSRITKDQWQAFKDSATVDPNLGDALSSTLKVETPNLEVVTMGATEGIRDHIDFSFDIKLLSISGTIYKSGKLEFTGKVVGVQIGHTTVDLSAGAVCFSPSVGFEEVRYCFYLKGNCLRTKGHVDGWFHKKETWDKQIVCL